MDADLVKGLPPTPRGLLWMIGSRSASSFDQKELEEQEGRRGRLGGGGGAWNQGEGRGNLSFI